MNKRRAVAIGGTFAAILVIVAVSFQTFMSLRELLQTFTLLEDTQAALQEIDALNIALVEAQAGQRAYLFSGDNQFILQSYQDTLDMTSFLLTRLGDVLRDDPEMERQLDALERLIEARLDKVSAEIEQRRSGGPGYRPDAAALMAARLDMDRIRALLSQMRYVEAVRYAERRRSVVGTAELTAVVLVIGVALAVGTILLVLVLMQREAGRRRESEDSLRELNADLDARVAVRTAELESANAGLEAEVAERRAVEDRLRSSEERYRGVVELIKEAIWIHKDARIVFANTEACRMFGAKSGDDILGMPAMDLIDPEDRLRAVERTRMLTQDRVAPGMTQMKLRRLDGEAIFAEIQAVPYMHEGSPAVLAAARDVTERRQLEAQLHQAQKMEALGQLTGGIAHDFNNILAIVIGNLELLAEDIGIAGDARSEQISAALHGALRGAELTNQLLTFSRRHDLALQAVDVSTLVGGLRSILQRTLGERVQVRLNIVGDLWLARTDSAQLESALVNLAINARDAMLDGGTLTVDASNGHLDEHYAQLNPGVVPGDYVVLALSDTGTGIPPDILERVFEPFFTTKRPGKGTGLGLSMIYGFARQSGGHVKIYSELGTGTTVRLYLPVAQRDAEAVKASAESDISGRGETILVVEDNPDVRAVAVGQLGRLGYSVLQADNGNAGLAVVQGDGHIDLLFTDIVMAGGMSGPDLAREARALRPGLKVLFTTGFADITQNGGMISEDDRIMRKPYRLQDLARTIRELLAEQD